MVAIQLKFLNLIALCTLVSSSVIYSVQRAVSPADLVNSVNDHITEGLSDWPIPKKPARSNANVDPSLHAGDDKHTLTRSNQILGLDTGEIAPAPPSIGHSVGGTDTPQLPIPVQGSKTDASEGQNVATGGQMKRAGIHVGVNDGKNGSSNGGRALGAVGHGLD